MTNYSSNQNDQETPKLSRSARAAQKAAKQRETEAFLHEEIPQEMLIAGEPKAVTNLKAYEKALAEQKASQPEDKPQKLSRKKDVLPSSRTSSYWNTPAEGYEDLYETSGHDGESNEFSFAGRAKSFFSHLFGGKSDDDGDIVDAYRSELAEQLGTDKIGVTAGHQKIGVERKDSGLGLISRLLLKGGLIEIYDAPEKKSVPKRSKAQEEPAKPGRISNYLTNRLSKVNSDPNAQADPPKTGLQPVMHTAKEAAATLQPASLSKTAKSRQEGAGKPETRKAESSKAEAQKAGTGIKKKEDPSSRKNILQTGRQFLNSITGKGSKEPEQDPSPVIAEQEAPLPREPKGNFKSRRSRESSVIQSYHSLYHEPEGGFFGSRTEASKQKNGEVALEEMNNEAFFKEFATHDNDSAEISSETQEINRIRHAIESDHDTSQTFQNASPLRENALRSLIQNEIDQKEIEQAIKRQKEAAKQQEIEEAKKQAIQNTSRQQESKAASRQQEGREESMQESSQKPGHERMQEFSQKPGHERMHKDDTGFPAGPDSKADSLNESGTKTDSSNLETDRTKESETPASKEQACTNPDVMLKQPNAQSAETAADLKQLEVKGSQPARKAVLSDQKIPEELEASLQEQESAELDFDAIQHDPSKQESAADEMSDPNSSRKSYSQARKEQNSSQSESA